MVLRPCLYVCRVAWGLEERVVVTFDPWQVDEVSQLLLSLTGELCKASAIKAYLWSSHLTQFPNLVSEVSPKFACEVIYIYMVCTLGDQGGLHGISEDHNCVLEGSCAP